MTSKVKLFVCVTPYDQIVINLFPLVTEPYIKMFSIKRKMICTYIYHGQNIPVNLKTLDTIFS